MGGKSALHLFASPDFLRAQWGDMYRASRKTNRDIADSDNETLNSFNNSALAKIQNLASQLRTDSFEFSPLTPFFIPKDDGRDRVICVPTIKDRLVQRALYNFLLASQYSFRNDVNFGFVKGKSVGKAVSKACQLRQKYPWACKADISSFFDEIDRELLKDEFQRRIRLRSLWPLINKVIEVEITNSNRSAREKIQKMGIKRGRGLRQGMPMSPYLANLVLYQFDCNLMKEGVKVVRYADDIIVFGRDKEHCKNALQFCIEELNKHNLRVHELGSGNKTQAYEPHESAEFLGMGISRKPNDGKYYPTITTNKVTQIKQRLHELSDIDYCLKNGVTLRTLLTTINSRIEGYKGTYSHCENFTRFSNSLDDYKKNILRGIFSRIGVQFDNLSNKEKRFLEIKI